MKRSKCFENIASSLESNIGMYSDYDVIEMKRDTLATLDGVRSYNVDCRNFSVPYKAGDFT